MNKLTKLILAVVLGLGSTSLLTAQNSVKTVDQVTEAVTISDAVDYTVTNTTPFGTDGVVDIANTDDAVLILANVKPSVAIQLLASHVTINGQKAVNGTNCQVKLYNLGSIILPHGDDFQPLTVYSEQNFEGESLNDFSLGHSGGYMNSLPNTKLNNKIRSFKLKRGYMVTFSTLSGGRGYSRCFIAAYNDLEVAELPPVLDKTISSYRIFKWYNTGKKQLANSAGSTDALSALNVQSTYDWGQGNGSLAPNIEWVANHIYEDWPSSSTIGSQTQSPHTKNNNEPKNKSDDHPQELTTILNNWENMMRTGLRLCSPASWDGSDYWNATGFLAEFMDSIDARGWRCDIIDLHCYWPESNFGNVRNWANKYGRPIWISEWCWGASWNSNGAFASGVTEANVKDALERICTNLNSWDCVERYYYWNGERDPSRLYKDGGLTAAGKYYAGMNSGLAYNGKYDFVPKNPRQYDPYDCAVTTSGGKDIVTWADKNGEYNQSMELQRRDIKRSTWETVATIEPKETESTAYKYELDAKANSAFRVKIVDVNGKARYSNECFNSIPEGTDFIQFGQLTVNDISESKKIEFTYAFDAKPAVFVGPMSTNNSNTTVEPFINSSAITKSAFTYSCLPWTSQPNGTTTFTKAENMHYMAIPFGNYEFGSMQIEVGTITIKGDAMEVLFTKPFPEDVTPVVVATVNRCTNKTLPTLHKVWDVTNTGFKCAVMYEQSASATINLNQYVSYIAVSPGYECIDAENGIYLAANTSTTPVYSRIGRSIPFTLGEGDEAKDLQFEDPYIFAELQTNQLEVPTSLRLASLTTTTFTDDEGDVHAYATSMRLRRMIDNSESTPTDNANSGDYVGWIAIHSTPTYDQLVGIQSPYTQAFDRQARISVTNRIIQVDGCSNYEIFSANGTRVAPYTVQAPGIYIVKANGKSQKVLVR